MDRDEDLICPRCGRGRLIDVTFDERGHATDARSRQSADSREVLTYSCGHEVVGASLAGADADVLDVEQRTSDETVDPSPGDS